MKSYSTVALSVLVGFAAGTAAIHTLHAQAKPIAYTIVEIDHDIGNNVSNNEEGYMKEYAPTAAKLLTEAGAKFLVRAGKTVSIEGEPPKKRVVVHQWENIDKAQAAFTSAAYKENRKIGDKYAKFRVFAVEGVPQ
jgi:uncharacterized protein (DUF1330 family)